MKQILIMSFILLCDLRYADGNNDSPHNRIISDFAKSLRRATTRLVVSDRVENNDRELASARNELGQNLQDMIRVYTNPYDVESQRKIEETIRLENVNRNLEHVRFFTIRKSRRPPD
jgi:hypothetical protein